MNKPPETIYLQCYDETGDLLDATNDEVTWCVDQINERDAVYTLASRVDYQQRREAASQRALARALHENRVRDECLEIAKEILYWYGRNCPVLLCGKAGEALDKIETLLVKLEPEEKTE